MTKAKDIAEKVEVLNVGNSKSHQWDGKKGDSYLMWKIKFVAHLTMMGLKDCLTLEFASELPSKEKDTFDLTSHKGKNWANAVKKNKKMMMQFVLSWIKVAGLNKLNCATRANKDWPSGKAHKVMMQLMKEYKPDDTMAEMEMEKALSKLSLSEKKDPNDLNDEQSAIKCRYKLELTKSKKKALIFRIGRAQYASIISMTQMIYRLKGVELTYEMLLKEMHNQCGIAGQDMMDSDNEEELAATATTKDNNGGNKKPYVNPNKDKICSHCKKKSHMENKFLKKNPELIPDKVMAAWKKQAEQKAEKTSTAATAFEDMMVLTMLDLQKDNSEFSCLT